MLVQTASLAACMPHDVIVLVLNSKLIGCGHAALEMAWHPYFNIITGKTRMNYAEPLNRPLFVALFKQMQVCWVQCFVL